MVAGLELLLLAREEDRSLPHTIPSPLLCEGRLLLCKDGRLEGRDGLVGSEHSAHSGRWTPGARLEGPPVTPTVTPHLAAAEGASPLTLYTYRR